MNLWEAHVKRWSGCQACSLAKYRRNVVLGKGQLPCHILFVGEGPGDTEDVEGTPFEGPAGHLLTEEIIEPSVSPAYRLAFTNIVACVPKEDGVKVHDGPPLACVKACAPRLYEYVHLAQPLLMVLVGKDAQHAVSGQSVFHAKNGRLPWLEEHEFLEFVSIDHPAYILRMPTAQKGLAIQRARVRLMSAIRDSRLLPKV